MNAKLEQLIKDEAAAWAKKKAAQAALNTATKVWLLIFIERNREELREELRKENEGK
jgi:hypothetical protein